MGAPALQWQIDKSRLPSRFKRILHVLAKWAEAEQGYSNIYPSKGTIAQHLGWTDRAAREGCSDLARFGLLAIVEASPDRKSKRETQYQILAERLAVWTDADTRRLAEFCRNRRPDGKAKTRAKGETKPGSADPPTYSCN